MKNKNMILGLLVFGAILMTSCATGPSFKKVETIPDGVGLVYIYRPMSPVGAGVSYEVRADGVSLVTILSGEYFVHYAQPGEVEFSARTESTSAITIDIKAGHTYYLKCTLSVGITVGRPQLLVVSSEIGQNEIAGCKLMEGKTAKAITKSSYNLVLVPKGPVLINEDIVGSIDGAKTTSFINTHEKSKVTLVEYKQKIPISKTYYDVDFKQVADFIITQLEEELKKKGLKIDSGSDNAIKIGVEKVEISQGMVSLSSVISLRVEKGDGTWFKTYRVEDSSGLSIQRAFNGAVHKAVIAILKDDEFKKSISR